MKINRTLFVVLLAGFLFGLATSQVKGRAQDITPTLPPPTFKWDLEIELTEEAVLVIQADTSIMEKQLDDQNTHMEISGNMLHLSGEESLEQVRQVAFEALAPFIDFLGGPTLITLNLPADNSKTLTISLEARIATGYSWEVVSSDGLRFNPVGEPTFTPRYPGYGAPQLQTLVVQPDVSGEGVLQLVYHRPFEPDAPIRTRLTIWVSEALEAVDLSDPNPEILFEVPGDESGEPASDEPSPIEEIPLKALPSSWDWRTQGIVPAIRDQNPCGSCWAFGTVGIMESAIKKSGGPLTDLSEQFLISCNYDGWSCSGGLTAHKYHYDTLGRNQTQIGAVLETDKPYTATNGTCSTSYNHPYRLSKWTFVTGSEGTVATVDQIKNAIYTYGPITAGMCAGPAFQAYSSGIFATNETVCEGSTNHQIILVGWDDPGQYWILRNSWGPSWGETGYMRIKWGTSRVGEGTSWVTWQQIPSDTTPPSGSWTNPSSGQTISSRSVTLSVNASDNSGGSGVKEVRFSAKWDGTWRGVGTASSSPYSVSWDMCSSGVPDGDIELGFEVWDNANNKWVYSEHYTNIHINKSYNCTQSTDTTPPTGSWTSPGNGQTISSQSVTLSVNASDNSGGSGVREVRWSAKWNNQWSGIGTDSTSPYSINWDMCAYGVPNGDIELGFEVWDNANNKWVYSEHYTNYHINKNYTCNSSPGGWETWGWQNKYLAGYDNWHGTVTWSNDYPYIWWDFGSGGPFGWGGDEFSLRMQKDVYFPGGDYSFHTEHDDGVKVYIDGNLIIDAWWDGNGGHDAGRNVSQGNHQVKVEFYENQGDAKLHVFWYGPGYPQPDNNPPDGRITSPANHSVTASSPLTITADAWDDVSGVDRVEFYVWYCSGSCDWHLIDTDYSSPYSATWDWSALSDQHVYLTTHIIDKTGKVRDDPGGYVEVDLDRTKPSADITSPVEGTVLSGTVPILVSANDSLSGVWKVQFIVGYNDTVGASLQDIPEPPPPATFDENGVILAQDFNTQDYWREIGWDENGSDGWSFNWDTSSVPEQSGIAVFVYVYDKAWNYQGAVQWNMSLYRPPVNDDISTPIQINSNSYTNQQNTYNATSAVDDPALTDCNRAPGDATVWYQFIPPSGGYYYINTIGSDYDTMLAIWTGTRGNLNLIACNDDRPSDLQSELIINVSSGVAYYIEIAKYAGSLAASLSTQSEDKQNIAGDVNALSGGMLNFNIVFMPYQIYLPLVFR